ncbi:hypothetical protein FB565_007845 [Actinoplanes lutulentus]|uniref:Subtilisin inhibitor-like n=1 Tax=Actinoplanes lutulentus TaxID=1287878 RepID=A0A327ZFH0_9ACTN|nr:hypothetical protein [Actinoplanes lutulentus]MBB2948074.1 hypothetical protein [Actinoplanes lutulentus]RAK40045.1 hypothetical protein B0I29_10371 [Actinoplanes lutulentus]
MRTSTVLAVGALFVVMAGGCAQNDNGSPDVATAQSGPAPAASSTSANTTDDADAPLKYAKCMRENGMTWFPDPDPDKEGRFAINLPPGVTPKDMEKAEKACRQWAPNGGEAPEMSAEDLEKIRQMAKCMRENGVPDFPDPDPDGRIEAHHSVGDGPGNDVFDKAQEICSQYLPKPPGGGEADGPATNVDGGGA